VACWLLEPLVEKILARLLLEILWIAETDSSQVSGLIQHSSWLVGP